jgi:hypothetical protein
MHPLGPWGRANPSHIDRASHGWLLWSSPHACGVWTLHAPPACGGWFVPHFVPGWTRRGRSSRASACGERNSTMYLGAITYMYWSEKEYLGLCWDVMHVRWSYSDRKHHQEMLQRVMKGNTSKANFVPRLPARDRRHQKTSICKCDYPLADMDQGCYMESEKPG